MPDHLANLLLRNPELQICIPAIEEAFDLLVTAYRAGNKLLLCGNGGSASDCEHWAGELLKGFEHKRPLSEAQRKGLPPEMADRLQWGLSAIPLTGFPAYNTAFCNDVDPEYVFAQLVLGIGSPGDVLAAISTSGNAANVFRAAQAAKARGVSVIVLTGESGGRLKDLADVCIRVPATQTRLVQEFHLPVYHCLSLMLEDYFAENEL